MKKTEEEEVTEEQKKLMRSQDMKYVEMKRVAEAKVCQLFPSRNCLFPQTVIHMYLSRLPYYCKGNYA